MVFCSCHLQAESLVQHLAADMASEGIEAKTLTLKLKTTAFDIRTRAVTLPQYVSTAAQMLPPILKLLKAELPVEIRLMGVRGSNLRKHPGEFQSGGRLNALQRVLLQGKGQQQQAEAGMHAAHDRKLPSGQSVDQQQPEQHIVGQRVDITEDGVVAAQLDDDLLHLADVGDYQENQHLNWSSFQSTAGGALTEAAEGMQRRQQEQQSVEAGVLQDQQAAVEQALWDDWQQQQQQRVADTHPVLVGMKRLHSHFEQQQQERTFDKHVSQRVKLEDSSRCQQQINGKATCMLIVVIARCYAVDATDQRDMP